MESEDLDTIGADAPEDKPEYQGWALLELMGHRKTAGMVYEVTVGGAKVLRVDTPGPNGEMVATQYYGGNAIYCMTPCDEAAVRRALEQTWSMPAPVRLALEGPKSLAGDGDVDVAG